MRVAVYVRVSTQRQAQHQTIDQQLHRLHAYIEAQGWLLDPAHIYQDAGYSGAKLDRPGLDSLRDHAALAEFEVVLITAPDRLARDYVQQMLLLTEFEQRGIRVEFLEHPMSSDPHDRLLLQIRGAVAEYERVQINERMRRGRLAKFRAGKLLPWRQPPYGYQVDPEHPRDPAGVRVDPAEAAIVAQMFAWYLEPASSMRGIAQRLTEQGLPTPQGKVGWGVQTVRNILRNPAYTGTAYANRWRVQPAQRRQSSLRPVGRGQGTRVERPREEWLPVSVPAIVEQVMFEQVQAKLAQNQRFAQRNNQRHPYLLRALVSCGHCRLSASGRVVSAKRNYGYYVCQGRYHPVRAARGELCTAPYIPAEPLDALVWQDLCQVLTDPQLIAHALERAHGGHWLPQELQARRTNTQQAITQLEHQQERLLAAYLAEVLGLPEFDRKRSELQRKQATLTAQLAQLEAQAHAQLELSQLADSIESFCAQVRPALENATFAQRRQLVELLIDRVIVTDSDVEIRYVIPTSPDGPHVPFCHLRKDYLRSLTGMVVCMPTNCETAFDILGEFG